MICSILWCNAKVAKFLRLHFLVWIPQSWRYSFNFRIELNTLSLAVVSKILDSWVVFKAKEAPNSDRKSKQCLNIDVYFFSQSNTNQLILKAGREWSETQHISSVLQALFSLFTVYITSSSCSPNWLNTETVPDRKNYNRNYNIALFSSG